MTIQFHGAAGTVTGSCYLLESNGETILIDAGMFQGTSDIQDLNLDVPQLNFGSIDAVILTHAHLDHCGRLPQFVSRGLSAPIYATRPTREIAEITLMDAAKIGENDPEVNQLFTRQDAINTLDMFRPLDYHQSTKLKEWSFELSDAGHILGSASILFTHLQSQQKIVFSGDLGNSPQELIKATENYDQANTVVMESTYGDRLHPTEDTNQLLSDHINQVETSGGTLLMPAFSIQRTQELLHRLHHLKKQGHISPHIPVYLDSPMAIKVTKTFGRFSQFFNQELADDFNSGDPFDFPGLEITQKHKQSLRISKSPGAKVIIAGSGMMTGGRILMHASTWLQDPASQLLFVGYQGVETLGREIFEGSKNVQIDGKDIQVRAGVHSIKGLSSHAGQDQLLSWLGHIKQVKQVFLTHGEEESRIVLKQKISQTQPEMKITLPKLHQEISI